MNYPIPVMKIAADAPLLYYKHVETWQSLYQRYDGPGEIAHRLTMSAAKEISNRFVSDVLKREEIKSTDTPEGKEIRFACVALTHRQLVDLLYHAYREGQTDAMRRAPSFPPEAMP